MKKEFYFILNICKFFVKRKNFWCIKKIINTFNFQYFMESNSLKFGFNLIHKEDVNSFKNYYLIDEKLLSYFIKYFSVYKDFFNLKKNFGDMDVFCISEKLFNDNITQYFISHFLPINVHIYIYKTNIELRELQFKRLKKFLKPTLIEKLRRNDLKTLKIINLFIANLSVWKNYNFSFNDVYKTLDTMKKRNIVRFGDGELSLAINNGAGAAYQEASVELADDMKKCIQYFTEKNSIALNDKIVSKTEFVNKKDMTQFDFVPSVNLQECIKTKNVFSSCCWAIPPFVISKKIQNYLFDVITIFINNKYYSIFDKELYKLNEAKKFLQDYNDYYSDFFHSVCSDKSVVLISAKSNQWFLKSELLKTSSNQIFMMTPETNSYSEKYEILDKLDKIIKIHNSNDVLFLISCGPLGKLLAKYIDEKKYRFIDIGNFINYYAYYNDKLNIEYVNVIHNPNVFIKAKKEIKI